MIKITMFENKWRIQIDEIWEFETQKELMKILNQLIDFKNKYGRLK